MTISINWLTSVITVEKTDMTLVQSSPIEIRELNLNTFRLVLKGLEDDENGITFSKTHNHNTIVTVGGVTLARVVEILDPYTITFENGNYAVNLVGANSNVADKTNLNSVSIRSANSAGLVQITSGSGLSQEEHDKLMLLPSVDNIFDEIVSEHNTNNTFGKYLLDMWEESFGKWSLDPIAKTLTIYRSDGITILKKFDLTETNGNIPKFIGRTPQ